MTIGILIDVVRRDGKLEHLQIARGGSEGLMDLSQRIIENYRSSSQSVRPEYLEYLAAKTQNFAQATEAAEVNQDRQTPLLVEKIFALLEPYITELNRVNRLKQLHLTAVSPSHCNEVLEYDRNRRPLKSKTFYRARFSTSRLSLVVRGYQNKVEFFIIPADRVIAMTAIEDQTEPLMVFENLEQNWWVEGKPLTADRFERYSLLTLEHLLDSTQQELLSISGL